MGQKQSKSSSTPLPKNQYSVGWLCSQNDEFTVAICMLHQNHGTFTEHGDSNTYHLGSMNGHNIVICQIPGGTISTCTASQAAANLKRTFNNIEVGLLVGTGGGVPSNKNDIRLGDIVVSTPGKKSSGVVPYTTGQALEGNRFQVTGTLSRPPMLLLKSAMSLSADHARFGNKILANVDSVLGKHPTMRTQGFGYDQNRQDQLYSGRDLVRRPAREVAGPVVHYGLIASGDRVVDDSRVRDRIGEEFGAMCFDTEAAGVMDSLPCLVIRGVSDYSDSHGNDLWRRYAAATAAGYAKELLSVVPRVAVRA